MPGTESVPADRTILVTGATGFIGKHLCIHLPGCARFRLRRLMRPVPGRIPEPGPDVWGDLSSIGDIRRFVEGGDCLIHLACSTNPRTSNRDVPADVEENLLGSVRLFEEFLRRNPAGHVIFASTGGDMYNYGPPHVPRRETDPCMPNSSYSIHKLAVENYLSLLCAMHGGRGTVLRIGNPYGERVSEERGQGLVGVALSKVLLGHELQVVEPINSVRDYLHLDDLASAFDAVLADPPDPGTCELYNVGSGTGHSIGEVIATVEAVTSRPLAWRNLARPGQPNGNNARLAVEYDGNIHTRLLRRYDSFTHVIEPTIRYHCISNSPNDIGNTFDEWELRGKTSRLELSILNRFLIQGKEMVTTRITQPLDMNKGDRPFRPLEFELGTQKPLPAQLSVAYDVNTGEIQTVTSDIKIPFSYGAVSFGQRYNQPQDIMVFKAGVEFQPVKPIQIGLNVRYDAKGEGL